MKYVFKKLCLLEESEEEIWTHRLFISTPLSHSEGDSHLLKCYLQALTINSSNAIFSKDL